MGAGPGVDKRDVVPRWRGIARTLKAGEFQVRQIPRTLDEHHTAHLEEARARWESERSDDAAAEFVGSALVSGELRVAEKAAETLLAHPVGAYRVLAERALGLGQIAAPEDELDAVDPTGFAVALYGKIANAKARLARDPRNALAWADIARYYTALGQFEQAERALRVARSLAPTSRYLLRATVRFLVHLGRERKALDLLKKSPRTREDPWLLAAAMSVANAAGLPPPGMKAAKRLLEDGRFRPIEQSELASELATVELGSGSDRRARSLFERSLADPTDNSLAQAQWASRRLTALEVRVEAVDVPFVGEARSRASAQVGNWSQSLEEGLCWLRDQPFDTGAAIHASYIASVGLEDWTTAKAISELGLQANPSDSILVNNLAYAQIQLGELEEAAARLSDSSLSPKDNGERVALTATRGLLLFRLGRAEAGRALYREAIDYARRLRQPDAELMAHAMLIGEELSAGTIDLDSLLRRASVLRESVHEAGVLLAIERSERLARRVCGVHEIGNAADRPRSQW